MQAGENLKRLATENNLTVNDFVNMTEFRPYIDHDRLAEVVHDTYLSTRGRTFTVGNSKIGFKAGAFPLLTLADIHSLIHYCNETLSGARD